MVSGCTSVHDLTSFAEHLPQPARALLNRLFLVEHETFRGVEPGHRISRIYNRWLGEATSFDERRRRRGPAPEAARKLQQHCEHEEECCICTESGKQSVLSRPGSGRAGRCFFFPPPSGFCQNHCLIFPEEHNPLCFRKDLVADMFACGEQWALRTRRDCSVHPGRPGPVYYFLSWNILCGSVVHAHCQVTLTTRFAEGGVERLARGRQDYAACYPQDYFDDLVALHDCLGLAVRCGDAVALPSLTPVKEREVWLLQAGRDPARLPEDLLALLTQVLESLATTAEAPCPGFNVAVAFPPLQPAPGWEDFPIVVRIVDRGWPTLGVTDWATMEMYGTRIVATDPFGVVSQLRLGRASSRSDRIDVA